MHRVTITHFHYEPDLKTFVGQVESVIEVSADGIRVVRGSSAYVDVPATDLERGGSIRAQDDPLRWASLIGETLSHGDIEVTVEEVAEPTPATVSVEPDSAATRALAALVQER